MTDLKYDPELPFAIVKDDDGSVLSRFDTRLDAESWFEYNNYDGASVIDTTPKPKIPEDAEIIAWGYPYTYAEFTTIVSSNHGKLWRISNGFDDLVGQNVLEDLIEDQKVTVLVRKDES